MGIRTLLSQIYANKFIRWAVLSLFIIALFLGGVQLRRWIGESTRHVRYQHDIVNAFYWGSETMKEARRLSPDEASANSLAGFGRGYLALYDRVKHKAYNKDYGLDYPPLRLLVMAIWAREVRNQFPGVDDGHPKLVNPLLKINLLCELLSAVAIFLLVRLCLEHQSRAAQSDSLRTPAVRHRASICGLAAASVAWLEPSMILDAHGWPQWDVWILPFYLFAALSALKNRWFVCGCLLATGAMFKGQLLFVAPFFVLWPLWQKRWNRALRVLAGFISAAALIASPWLLCTPAAWVALLAVTGFSALLSLQRQLPHRGAWISGIAGCAAFAIGAVRRWKLRVAAGRFSVWQRALPLPCHQFVLQPSVTSFQAWLVIEGSVLVGSFWTSGFRAHAPMDPAAALPGRTHSMRIRRRATGSRSRPARPDSDHRSVAV